ncbi:MAG: DUF4416 family protein [Desulfobacterales bacterium]|jgi:hypothetical protein|nr:DUF4416 family protein [Desulfobacterales bacterium]
MSQPQPPQSAKLVIGLFTRQKDLFHPIAAALSERFGAIDMISSWFPFDYTNYYETEMGTGLFRRMVVFKQLIGQDALSTIKLATNTIEKDYCESGKRRVNIDPGYLLLERFVLATGKNFAHRIYIGHHIYADLTLIYTQGNFQTLPWTYPDYAGDEMIGFLKKVRKKFALDLKVGA